MSFSKKQIFSAIFLSIFSLTAVVSALPAQADQSLLDSQAGLNVIGKKAYGNATPADVRTTAGKVINIILGFLGVIFLALTVFAGFKYMTSAGNEEQTKEAIGLLRNAIIGLIIVLMAWGITRFSVWVLSRTVNNAVDYQYYSPY
jgi:tetrahydromethanopterin S-methyltransferase subunit B